MPRKPLSAPRSVGEFVGLALVVVSLGSARMPAAEPFSAPKFVGDQSCAASACHGGGSAEKGNNAYSVWLKQDVHLRSVLTLGNARSKQIAAAAKLGDPLTEQACTLCHAPLNHVPAALQLKPLDGSRGLSCESCHAPAENWLLSHTRADYSHADRIHAGMRDLANPYVRANQCVACHHAVPSNLLKAGHPELIFELDGQTKSLPPHWKEEPGWKPVSAWLVGQAVAYRELCWQLERESDAAPRIQQQADALRWLLKMAAEWNPLLSKPPSETATLAENRAWADNLAKVAAELTWPEQQPINSLKQMAGTSSSFSSGESGILQARRAERLALAIDRLYAALPPSQKSPKLDTAIGNLFTAVQSLADFDTAVFRKSLEGVQQLIQ